MSVLITAKQLPTGLWRISVKSADGSREEHIFPKAGGEGKAIRKAMDKSAEWGAKP